MIHHLKIPKNDIFVLNSKNISIKKNQQYQLKTNIKAIKGLKYSAYVFVILLDDLGNELSRHISWINKIGNESNPYEIIFFTNISESAIIGYRINHETPVKSEFEIEFEDLDNLKFIEIKDQKNKSDDITNFIIPKMISLTEEEENTLEKKIVWLMGSPRSGTTWLGSQLLSHVDNYNWLEPWIGFHIGTPITSLIGIGVKKTPKYLSRLYDIQRSNPDYFFSPHHEFNWIPLLKKLIIGRMYSQIQSFDKNIIIKEPVGSHASDILLRTTPNSKLIFLIRDGRDVVASMLDTHSNESWMKWIDLISIDDNTNRKMMIEWYSILWNFIIEKIDQAYEHHDPKLRIIIKYENLKKDPLFELGKIYNFLNIKISTNELEEKINFFDFEKISPSKKGKGKFYRSAKINGWKDSFNFQEQKLMNSIMEETLKKHDYNI